MPHWDLSDLLEYVGKDPSRLIFEDELTGIHNRRFLLSYLEHRVSWRSGKDFPLSLLIIDLDQFKQVNDTHGHETGDQALTWMAILLKEVVGGQGVPIRFGGDEFMLLLPKAGRNEAREMADRLLQRTRDRPFQLRDAAAAVPITLSIGYASAPQDATSSKGLYQAADTALFHAKQSGRDQAASAADIDPEKVFPRTALHRLKATGIAGRDEEMAVVSEALEGTSRGQSQFLVLEAAPGMGKTTFLETVRHNLAGDDTFCVTQVSGDQQEGYRPYYLASRILVSALKQREDRGTDIMQDLTKEEVSYLSRILPQLTEEGSAPPVQDDRVTRHAIFTTLAKVLPRAADFRPLVLLIDDMHFTDEATLLLLRVLIQRQELTILVCGTAQEALELTAGNGGSPLERFCVARQKELGIRRVKLSPLSADDIADYLKSVFPSLKTPDGFEAELARTTQGNPLFLTEIIRKLVADRKVTLGGQGWVIEELEDGYLPRSLEEIVVEKIAALDKEGQDLLQRAALLGDVTPISILTGSSELDENKVLEFLDRAEALGLVSLDFQINDEIMRFLGKRVMEISYGAIDESRREELHEEVGEYQEGLYRQRLLPSASLLAYHFKRSANQEKALRYEQIQHAFSQTVFDAAEAVEYTGELVEDDGETETRLDPESIPRVPFMVRMFMSAVRNIQLYPPDSKPIADSLREMQASIDAILVKNDRLHLAQAQRVLLVNGQRLDVSRFQLLANSLLALLTRCELQGIVFQQGFTREEIRALLMTLGGLKPEAIDPGFWRTFTLENGLQHLELRQVRYSRLRRKKGRVTIAVPVVEEELGPKELVEVPKILRTLHGAAQNAKLYPMNSKPVSRSLDQLHESLQGVFKRRGALTLARADESLLANGNKVDATGFAPLAANFLSLLDSVGLSSITFSVNVSRSELEKFVGALQEPPPPGEGESFWDEFAREKGLSQIAFNQRRYASGVVESLLGEVEVEIEEDETAQDPMAAMAEQMLLAPSDALRDALPRFGKELLVKGEHKLVRRLLRQLIDHSQTQDATSRERSVQAFSVLMDGLILGLQHKFTELAVDPLLSALSEETQPRVLHELANVLYAMSGSAVQFADYQTATRILLEIKAHQKRLDGAGGKEGESSARLLDRKLDTTAQKLLVDDMKSGQPDRQGRAAQVVGGLGSSGIPLLIQVIKEEKDFRVRQMAASLLAESGPQAGQELKRALDTEVTVEQRFRILEVIDTVTHDLRAELTYCLGDASAKIRRAAFRLFERLHDDGLIDVMVPLAQDEESAVAKGAIRSLAHLRSAAAVKVLCSILDDTEDSKVAIACCQALGEIGDANGIDALAKVLGQRKHLFLFGRRWDEQVRATAAMALRQISHHRAGEVLSRFRKDGDTRVRQLAVS